MSLYLGNTKISEMYYGSTRISQAYLGTNKLYEYNPTPTWATANVGGQIWMAENLAYDDGGVGIHHEPVSSNGVDLGEQYYYNSAAIMRISGNFPGWHFPSYSEMSTLSANGTSGNNYNRLRSTTGWAANTNGTDDYGFNIYPAGNYNCVDVATGRLDGVGTQANLFCYGNIAQFARARFMRTKSNINNLTDTKAWGWWYSVRLIKDSE